MFVWQMVEVATVEQQRSLEREIRVLRAVQHPNIVRYLGMETIGPTRTNPLPVLRLFMEFAPAGSVASAARRFGPFAEPVVRSMARQLFTAIAYLHERGIAHRYASHKTVHPPSHHSDTRGLAATSKAATCCCGRVAWSRLLILAHASCSAPTRRGSSRLLLQQGLMRI